MEKGEWRHPLQLLDPVSFERPLEDARKGNPSGGGGILILFVVSRRAIFRGTFFKPLRNYGYHFHNF